MTIISHKHKFIFLKTRKTASGALETALARYCGEDDILMLSADVKKAKINREQNNGGWPPSVRATPDAIHLLAKGHPFRSLDLLINSGKKLRSTHSTLEEVKSVTQPKEWQSYYKFCFERNPYDRLVSFYYWRTRKKTNPPDFKTFAMSIFNHRDKDINRFNAHQFSNRPFYLDKKNQLAIDKVCKWESINSEMQEVARKIGLDWDGQIPKTKANHRPKGPHWQEYFDNELREAAKRHFALELELFGYDAI